MKQSILNQWTILASEDTHLEVWIDGFLQDRKAQQLSKGTLYFYKKKLELFLDFCQRNSIAKIPELSPHILREYLLWLDERGHKPGGINACYRALKTFLLWWEDEVEPEGWTNPIRKLRAPRLNKKMIQPVSLNDITAMLDTCDNSNLGIRDKAILLCLLDTGVRASELCAMKIEDINRIGTSIFINNGKGGKQRTDFLGKKSRKAMRRYINVRKSHSNALWVTQAGSRLTYWGLRQILRRRSEKAQIEVPGIHDFRRAFALQCLRNGMDVYSLQKLMGHADLDLQVLQRYLAQTTEDISKAHRIGSPVDNSNL